jgi:hypothetical protein
MKMVKGNKSYVVSKDVQELTLIAALINYVHAADGSCTETLRCGGAFVLMVQKSGKRIKHTPIAHC